VSTIWDDMRSIANEDWRRDAACSHSPDLTLWDATVEGESPDRRKQRHDDAKTICASCPVAIKCRAAVDRKKDSGIRDGELLPAFREPMGSQRGRPPKQREINHGKEGGYVTHLRRGEKPCQACRIAADEARERRKKKATG